jgi:hypothetical protein
MQDARGLDVTCDSAAALAAVDQFARRIVSLDLGAEAVLADAERFPDTPLLQLGAAAAWLFAETAAGDAAAARFLDRAAALRDRANAREEHWRAALDAWRRHAFSDAGSRFEALTETWPRDLLAAKVCEFLYYVLGQQHEGARFRRHMERLVPYHDGDPDFLAMLAFACELTGDGDAARAAAGRALEARRRNPWADHALSHVWIAAGEVDAAIAHLTAALPEWDTCNPVIRAHDAWHLAIHHLDRLDFVSAEALLDGWIWGDGSQVGYAVDAVSLLWRIEMAGEDRSARWPAIAERVATWVEPCFQPFLAAHWAYALARAGREDDVARLLRAVDAEARRADPDATRAWLPVGCALVEAAAAFGRGHVRQCVMLLDPVAADVTVVGGSDAQCDLFRLMHVRALAASGRRAGARRALDRLFAGKRPTPLDARWGA